MTVTYISNERKVYGCVSRDSTRTDSSTAHRTEPADVLSVHGTGIEDCHPASSFLWFPLQAVLYLVSC